MQIKWGQAVGGTRAPGSSGCSRSRSQQRASTESLGFSYSGDLDPVSFLRAWDGETQFPHLWHEVVDTGDMLSVPAVKFSFLEFLAKQDSAIAGGVREPRPG